MHHQFIERNPLRGLEAHSADAALYALDEAEEPHKGKETLAVIPAGGGIHAKEEAPKIMMGSGKITEGINEVLQKLDCSFDIIAHVARLNTRLEPSMQPQMQYDQKAKEVMRQTGCGPVEPVKRTDRRDLMIIAKRSLQGELKTAELEYQ